jgi:dTDP-glucose pyrophosphorylase
VERLVLGGADKLCFVISPGKSDILEYYGGEVFSARVFYSVQPHANGLCDAIFRARHLVGPTEQVLIGLPDTIWFPSTALRELPDDELSFLLFPVERPQLFDAVVLEQDRVVEIQVKHPDATSRWIWGAFKLPGRIFAELHDLWNARGQRDEYVGTLVNAWIASGGTARGVRAGSAYVDVGTVRGYREAVALLGNEDAISLTPDLSVI